MCLLSLKSRSVTRAQRSRFNRGMSYSASVASASPLRVLLLHGYTQSGPLFSTKSRALHKALQKFFSPRPVLFSYPTGPFRLKSTDVVGFDASTPDSDEDIEAFAWWQRKDTEDGVIYMGIEEGTAAIASCIMAEGPFDGVIGFSQGAAAAVMVASLLEGQKRVDGFTKAEKEGGIPYPASFKNDSGFLQQPLKFAVEYSGFRAPGQKYKGFYEPKIETPVLHFLGQMDAIVEEKRSRALVAACEAGDKNVAMHPGGHFLPSQRPWLDACVAFVKSCVTEGQTEVKRPKVESVEDMDVPF